MFKVTDQISGKWKTKSIMWQFCNFCFLTLTFSPQKMDMNLISDRLSTASIKYLNWPSPVFRQFQNGCNKVVIEPRSRSILVWFNFGPFNFGHVYDLSPNCAPLSSVTVINNEPLSHKLRCYTRISGPEKSPNNTREKVSYF